METTAGAHRSTAERACDTLERLDIERDVWVSTAHHEHGPHQVPLWFLWDGQAAWICTGATSATVRNVRTDPRVRLALPDSYDVVLVEGEGQCLSDGEAPEGAALAFADKFGWDPRSEEKRFTYVRIAPRTVRAWRGEAELRGRVVMRDGAWLE
ncbi:pyridoxamine 5'-phosphate oxidase family protein [Streptomyces althioticus]|uniref:pyridoxamine 5'-phosphate oxidase family protein n=1 Tax=Streptomyces althioticus TaxID=83380 RepID=UPI0033FD45A3